jgi:putative acetyltransferase
VIVSLDRIDRLEIKREALDSPAARTLIARLNAELDAAYPEEGANHFRLDPEEIAPGRGAFFVAYLDDEPVGCGAVRRLDGRDAEVKRMFVAERLRGRGLGRALLDTLEDEARALGATRLVLETGTRQREAMALYERAGFRQIPLYDEYLSSPRTSLCMAKEL